MAFTQDDADRLRAAIAKGVSHARINGEELTFRSLADMKETLRMIEAELTGIGTAAGFSVGYVHTSRGL